MLLYSDQWKMAHTKLMQLYFISSWLKCCITKVSLWTYIIWIVHEDCHCELPNLYWITAYYRKNGMRHHRAIFCRIYFSCKAELCNTIKGQTCAARTVRCRAHTLLATYQWSTIIIQFSAVTVALHYAYKISICYTIVKIFRSADSPDSPLSDEVW